MFAYIKNIVSSPSQLFVPRSLSRQVILVYLVLLALVSVLHLSRMLDWYMFLMGIIEVCVFFFYGNLLSRKWQVSAVKRFERRLFGLAFFIRLVCMLLLYAIFMQTYGHPFGFDASDAVLYHRLGEFMASHFRDGDWNIYQNISLAINSKTNIGDMGYGTYVGLVYFLTNDSIFAVRFIKCLLGAWTAVLMYRLAARNFGEGVGRMTGLFICFMPNFWYYCTCHLKEVEMVFLTVLFIEQADAMLRSHKFTVWKVIPLLLVLFLLYTVRTPLAIVAVLALLFAVVMSSHRVVKWEKRIAVGVLAFALVTTVAGNRIVEEAQQMQQMVAGGAQQTNMNFKATRHNGNVYAKYAGAAVFAPMIFTIPFPTMVDTPEQYVQKLLNGGNFIKNILSFFVILVMFMLLLSGKWRDHMLPLSILLGYLMVLVFSAFAQSERFHQPALPFELMFAAYGISILYNDAKYRRWFKYWTYLMFIAGIGWNYIKLKGRGMV